MKLKNYTKNYTKTFGLVLPIVLAFAIASGCNNDEKKKAEDAKAAVTKAKEQEGAGKLDDTKIKQLEDQVAKSDLKVQKLENKLSTAQEASPAENSAIDGAKKERDAAVQENVDLKKQLADTKADNDKKAKEAKKKTQEAAKATSAGGAQKPEEKADPVDPGIQQAAIDDLRKGLTSPDQATFDKSEADLEKMAKAGDKSARTALQDAVKPAEASTTDKEPGGAAISDKNQAGINKFLADNHWDAPPAAEKPTETKPEKREANTKPDVVKPDVIPSSPLSPDEYKKLTDNIQAYAALPKDSPERETKRNEILSKFDNLAPRDLLNLHASDDKTFNATKDLIGDETRQTVDAEKSAIQKSNPTVPPKFIDRIANEAGGVAPGTNEAWRLNEERVRKLSVGRFENTAPAFIEDYADAFKKDPKALPEIPQDINLRGLDGKGIPIRPTDSQRAAMNAKLVEMMVDPKLYPLDEFRIAAQNVLLGSMDDTQIAQLTVHPVPPPPVGDPASLDGAKLPSRLQPKGDHQYDFVPGLTKIQQPADLSAPFVYTYEYRYYDPDPNSMSDYCFTKVTVDSTGKVLDSSKGGCHTRVQAKLPGT